MTQYSQRIFPRPTGPAPGRASRTTVTRWSACRRGILGAAVALLASACSSGVLLPGGDLLRDVYLRGCHSAPTVALTFDDGPNGRCTEAVLDVLGAFGAPATFFVLGENVASGHNDRLLARMVREGHTIGLHSETHGVRPLLLSGLTASELREAHAAVAEALHRAGIEDPPPVTLFRPPFGFLTDAAARAAASAGLKIVEWTISVQDWEPGRTAADVTEAILARVRPGDVIVLHDGDRTHQRSLDRCRDRRNAAETVQLLLPALAARGLRPAPLPELLGLGSDSRSGALGPSWPCGPGPDVRLGSGGSSGSPPAPALLMFHGEWL